MPFRISDMNNSETIKFLIENYDKSARIRMRWNQSYEKSVKEAATLQREETGYIDTDVYRACMTGVMAATARDHQQSGVNRRLKPIRDATFIPGVAHLRKGHSIPEVGLGNVKDDPRLARADSDLALDPKMRLMDRKERKTLYKNVPSFGREVYLKKRARVLPEKRYYLQETEGMVYGWRLLDSYFGKGGGSKYGRVWNLTKGTRSLTGPHADPDHYQNPDLPGVSKCLT